MITTTPSRRSRAATARRRVLGGGVAFLMAIVGVTFAAPSTAGAASTGEILPNTTLAPSWYVDSGNGEYRLQMQQNGNLELLVLDGSIPVWQSGTFGNPGARAVVQNDGNFVVYTTSNQPRWQSGTAGAAEIAAATLQTNEYLVPGELLVSPNGNFALVMQNDGNVVLYDTTGRARFQTKTYGPPGDRGDALVMTAGGNLMVVDEVDEVLWDTPPGAPGSYAVLQNDGNFVVYTPGGAPVWQTGSYN